MIMKRVSFFAGNSSRRIGKGEYRWTFFVESNENIRFHDLSPIREVEIELHQSFNPNIIRPKPNEIDDVEKVTRWEITRVGYGTFDIIFRIRTCDGRLLNFKHPLSFRENDSHEYHFEVKDPKIEHDRRRAENSQLELYISRLRSVCNPEEDELYDEEIISIKDRVVNFNRRFSRKLLDSHLRNNPRVSPEDEQINREIAKLDGKLASEISNLVFTIIFKIQGYAKNNEEITGNPGDIPKNVHSQSDFFEKYKYKFKFTTSEIHIEEERGGAHVKEEEEEKTNYAINFEGANRLIERILGLVNFNE